MREQAPEERVKNFNEVPAGYSDQEAVAEAARCLGCKKPMCVEGCPVQVQIPRFIAAIRAGDFLEAVKVLRETNTLPAVCGRVCPQETQCEIKCILGKKSEPVAIGRLERFAADFERTRKIVYPEIKPNGRKAAIVGSGPAGLTCAGDLAKLGFEVHVFEALHEVGGVLVYGIPEFRLPKAIVKAEVDYLKHLGVRFHLDEVVGRSVTVQELFDEGYEAIFVGTGAGLPNFLGVPGENLLGIYSANEYLTRVNLMKAYKFPQYHTPILKGDRVIVLGGGNVAMDSARTALRLGGKDVRVVYRRSRDEMPARREEVHHAEQEGVRFDFLSAPLEFIGDDKGWVRAARFQRMELGEPDASGRRRPVPIAGSEYSHDVDAVVVAVGNSPHPLIGQTTENLKQGRHGNIEADQTGATSIPGLFAGGDIVTGAATVIEAMGAGKRAAAAMADYVLKRG